MSEPVLVGLLFADHIITEKNGKRGIIGTFTNITSEKFPAVFRPWHIYAAVTNIEGNHEFALNLVKDDTSQVILPISGQIGSKESKAVIELDFDVTGAVFPAPGDYNLTLLIDGNQVGTRILEVKKRLQTGKANDK